MARYWVNFVVALLLVLSTVESRPADAEKPSTSSSIDLSSVATGVVRSILGEAIRRAVNPKSSSSSNNNKPPVGAAGPPLDLQHLLEQRQRQHQSLPRLLPPNPAFNDVLPLTMTDRTGRPQHGLPPPPAQILMPPPMSTFNGWDQQQQPSVQQLQPQSAASDDLVRSARRSPSLPASLHHQQETDKAYQRYLDTFVA